MYSTETGIHSRSSIKANSAQHFTQANVVVYTVDDRVRCDAFAASSRRLATCRLSVELFARRSDRRPVRLQPGHQPADGLHELFAQRRERVLDAGRHFGIDVAPEQAVALQHYIKWRRTNEVIGPQHSLSHF